MNWTKIVEETNSKILSYIFPLIGLGANVKELIDYVATKIYDDLYEYIKINHCEVSMLAIEGERDGISGVGFQKEIGKPKRILFATDPIEGTLSLSRGGNRSFSVIGIFNNKNLIQYKSIPDELSILEIASNEDENFINSFAMLNSDTKKISNIFKEKFAAGKIATLNRIDNIELVSFFLEISRLELLKKYPKKIDLISGYRRNVVINENIFVGDSTIPLPLECDNFLGRVGATEALFESKLWRYWRGMIVSGTKIKKENNSVEYIKKRIKALENQSYDLEEFFTKEEIEKLLDLGWKDREIMSFLRKEDLSPTEYLIYIFSYTGSNGSQIDFQLKNFLNEISYDENQKKFTCNYWKVKDNMMKSITYEFPVQYFKDWYEFLNWSEFLESKRENMTVEEVHICEILSEMEKGKKVDISWNLKDAEILLNIDVQKKLY